MVEREEKQMNKYQSRFPDIPVIAFFGGKGGVGKTTITNKFADLVTMAKGNPKVLLIDFDVSARGTTVFRTQNRGFSSRTLHDYIAKKSTEIEKVEDITETIEVRGGREKDKGLLYLIPSATPNEKHTFYAIARMEPKELLEIIRSLIDNAIERYEISCVLIDCGPTLNDPYTAAAAHISERAFIIAQNEPTCREALKNYLAKIREYYEDFDSMKMETILNKVRAAVPESMGFFSIIPFTIDIVDVSEGIKDVDQIRLTLLDRYIFDTVKRTFEDTHRHLIPDAKVILPKKWRDLVEKAPELTKLLRMKLYWVSKRFLLPFVGLLLTVGLIVFKSISDIDKIWKGFSIDYLFVPTIGLLIISGAMWGFFRQYAVYIDNLIEEREEFLFAQLGKKSGRRRSESLKGWLKKVKNEEKSDSGRERK